MEPVSIGESLPKPATVRSIKPRICTDFEIESWKLVTQDHPRKWFAIREFELSNKQSETDYQREYRKAQAQTRSVRCWLNGIKSRFLSRYEQDSLSWETAGRVSKSTDDEGVVHNKFTMYIRYVEGRTPRRVTSA